MKDEIAFRQYLKRAGKKENVIDGLVHQVRLFEDYLLNRGLAGLDEAGGEDLNAYVAGLDPQQVTKRVRGVGLYFRFAGNRDMARLAGEIREKGIAKTRKAFHLRDFRGVSPQDADRLEAIKIITVEDMLQAGKTPQLREQLAGRTGVSPQVILELVKLSDLSRLGAIKEVRARLYYDAGLTTPEKFTHWEAEALREMLVKWVEETGFEGIAPLPKEIRNAVEAAHRLPQLVEYENLD